MTSKIKVAFAACSILTAAGTGAALSADGITFGDKPSFQSDSKFSYALSQDKKAFTLAFDGLEVQVDGGKLPQKIAKRVSSPAKNAPVATRVFSTVIPVHGGKKGVATTLYASGYVLTMSKAGATLLFSVNGQNTVTSFGPNADKSFVHPLYFKTSSADEIRMTVFLLAEREGQEPAAYLNVFAIDTDAAQAKKRVAGK
jgi:hypothetical protein